MPSAGIYLNYILYCGMDITEYSYVVVGSGLLGAVTAERIASHWINPCSSSKSEITSGATVTPLLTRQQASNITSTERISFIPPTRKCGTTSAGSPLSTTIG